MKKFWPVVGTVLAVIFLGLAMLPQRTSYTWQPSPAAQATKIFLMASLVAVVWAICFRRQVEALRISLFSLLALIAMESVLLWAMRAFGHFR